MNGVCMQEVERIYRERRWKGMLVARQRRERLAKQEARRGRMEARRKAVGMVVGAQPATLFLKKPWFWR